MTDHESYMQLALAEAEAAAARGEVPVGAVLVRGGIVIAAAGNTREQLSDPLGHAELNVLAAGSRILGDWRLSGCTLYVTVEPCAMCAGAIVNARIDRVVYGASEPVTGCVGSRIHLFDLDLGHRPLVTAGVLAERCGTLMTNFFAGQRQ